MNRNKNPKQNINKYVKFSTKYEQLESSDTIHYDQMGFIQGVQG